VTEKTGQSSELEQSGNILVEFSMLELKEAYEKDVRKQLFGHTIRMEDIEDTLLYLSRIEALQIEGGFLVLYNRLQIDRLVLNNKMQYKQDDYHKLELFYANKIQQINIVGEYVRKMLSGNSDALEFVDDYFQLNYSSFLQKYFPGKRRDEINRKMTNTKLQRLLGELSETQLEIVKDDRPGSIVVMAGPGSGKTRVLVHKLAYLLLEEDVKHEQLLMLTFSRAAASEFRRRLWDLIGTAAGYVEIKTFHSYCFDLLGLQGSLEKSSSVIIDAKVLISTYPAAVPIKSHNRRLNSLAAAREKVSITARFFRKIIFRNYRCRGKNRQWGSRDKSYYKNGSGD